VPVDVEDLHGIPEFVVVTLPMVAMADLLEPERERLLPIRHPRPDGRGHDRVDRAEVIAAVREPWVENVRLAHVFQADCAIRLPRLLDRRPVHHPDTEGRAAVLPVHRAPLSDDVRVPAGGNLLDVALRRVRRMMVGRPWSE
jgi:hypothetical protein